MVRTGAEQANGRVEVLAGLSVGERVVLAAGDVRNGDRIVD
jgi:hypothetical protein